MPDPRPIAVFLSGSGSNLQALIDRRAAGDLPCDIAVVISDHPGAGGLERARRAGIPTDVVEWSDHPDRTSFTAALCDAAERRGVAGVVLAGFMRILAPVAIERFPDAIINVHPALLPAFPGVDAVEQALAHGVRVTGVTVHFVDEEVDHGPIIAQEAVPVLPDDDVATLHARIRTVEHRLLPAAAAAFCRGDLDVVGRHVRWSAPSGRSAD